MPIQEQLAVNESEAARLLGVSAAALRKWRSESRGPRFLKFARCVRYLVSDLSAWIALHTVSTEAHAGGQKGRTPEDHSSTNTEGGTR